MQKSALTHDRVYRATADGIRAFAKQLDIASGIDLGRLQHDRVIPYPTRLNTVLKERRKNLTLELYTSDRAAEPHIAAFSWHMLGPTMRIQHVSDVEPLFVRLGNVITRSAGRAAVPRKSPTRMRQRAHNCQRVHVVSPENNFTILDRHDRNEAVLTGDVACDDTPEDLVLKDHNTIIATWVHNEGVDFYRAHDRGRVPSRPGHYRRPLP